MTDQTLCYTGVDISPTFSNANVAGVNGYINYVDVNLDKDEHVDSVTGAGTYLAGASVTITAVVTDADYTFD